MHDKDDIRDDIEIEIDDPHDENHDGMTMSDEPLNGVKPLNGATRLSDGPLNWANDMNESRPLSGKTRATDELGDDVQASEGVEPCDVSDWRDRDETRDSARIS